ncbi:hypothetical protein V2S66_24065 [Streptomyces sp. V4-01]|uniref:Uncharacterized protein n=1 Tax=Actinacidiphila polyblastidii TaxID=3110430 RepID=A0ABU7PGU5_9ACTN|nr:hypothetical protein [Streptomyces sp. V4-01]
MTYTGVTTDSDREWNLAGAHADRHPHHARAERPPHHAAGSLAMGRIVLLSASVLIVLAAVLLVTLG